MTIKKLNYHWTDIITDKNWRENSEVFRSLNNLRRWTDIHTESRYDEISKQALNGAVCFILAALAESKGMKIQWERFPKIAIYRAFQKVYVNFDTPEYILRDICSLGNIMFDKAFGEVTEEISAELTDEKFVSWLKEGLGTEEEKIFKASTKIATLLELKELQRKINGDYSSKYEEVVKAMNKFEDIPGFVELSDTQGEYFKVFEAISNLRNQNRWASYSYLVECSVLGHLFDTAIFAYFMALENGESETAATKCFFMGFFHDVPETFTRDIPSPIKDRIPGFRELTEMYELQMMEKHVYPKVSKDVEVALKDIMFEDESNAEFKKLMKGADYMSAVSEIWRQFVAGTRDYKFYEAVLRHQDKFEQKKAIFTPSTKALFEKMCRFIYKSAITEIWSLYKDGFVSFYVFERIVRFLEEHNLKDELVSPWDKAMIEWLLKRVEEQKK